MAMLSDVKTYIEQWVKTATQGNVTVDYAWFQDRMEMRCKKCHAIFRHSLPESPTTIDWEVQEWVNRHVPDGIHDKEIVKPPAPTPVTADFKVLPNLPKGSKLLSPAWQADASEAKALLLQAQMEKYKAEQSATDLDKKVEWLQKTEAQKAEVSKAQDDKAKEQALQNLLNLMVNMGVSKSAAQIFAKAPAKHPLLVKAAEAAEVEPPAPVEKLKKAVIAVGRRFR